MGVKVTDIIFALICGRIVGFLISDFLKEWGIHIGLYYGLVLWVVLPFISLLCLWLASLIGKKFLFVFQAAKFLLIGASATVIDLKLFELLAWLLAFIIPFGLLVSKGISFLAATILKYLGNKYWAFGKHQRENLKGEIIKFFAVTLTSLVLDVGAFYYLTKIMGPQFNLSVVVWIKLSVLLSAVFAALWNFLGYKFLVFEK